VVLDEDEVAPVVDDLGQVALFAASVGEGADANGHGGLAECLAVVGDLLLGALVDHPLQGLFAEAGLDRFEELDGELAVAVGEELGRQRRVAPADRRPAAPEDGAFEPLDQTGLLERVEMLTHGRRCRVELVGQLVSRRRVGALEHLDDPAFGIGEVGHAGQSTKD
jgi:hypothetical protein